MKRLVQRDGDGITAPLCAHRALGVVCPAEAVRIHPFADDNGRLTGVVANLVFVPAQDADTPELYEWHHERRRYVGVLWQYELHRAPRDLAAFIDTRTLGE